MVEDRRYDEPHCDAGGRARSGAYPGVVLSAVGAWVKTEW